LGKLNLKSKNSLKALLVLAALTAFAASCLKQQQKADVTVTGPETAEPDIIKTTNKDYSKFSHRIPEHKEQCDSCHKRNKDFKTLRFPGHDSCVRCHLTEFTNPESSICIMCHKDLKETPPTMNAFPTRFIEGFNMKFDHAAHSRGAGRPQQGCAACHQPRGAAQSIPVGIGAHANCYTCHTPESNISACSVCHQLAPYRRTQPARTVFKAVFSHADHTSRQGVNCAECHSVIAGAPQSRQVTTPVAVEHQQVGGVSCRTCHNDVRAFGENNFSNCQRCHTGSGFDMLP
jgi:c(7)-type cytochrome triheme protein